MKEDVCCFSSRVTLWVCRAGGAAGWWEDSRNGPRTAGGESPEQQTDAGADPETLPEVGDVPEAQRGPGTDAGKSAARGDLRQRKTIV